MRSPRTLPRPALRKTPVYTALGSSRAGVARVRASAVALRFAFFPGTNPVTPIAATSQGKLA